MFFKLIGNSHVYKIIKIKWKMYFPKLVKFGSFGDFIRVVANRIGQLLNWLEIGVVHD